MKNLLLDKITVDGIKLTIFLNLIAIIISLVVINRVPPQIPFFYTLPWGEAQLANKLDILKFMAGIFISLISITIIIAIISKKDLLLSRILSWSLVLINLLALLVTVTVWMKVGY